MDALDLSILGPLFQMQHSQIFSSHDYCKKDVLPTARQAAVSIPVGKPHCCLSSLHIVLSWKAVISASLVPGGEQQQFLTATVTVMKDSCLDIKPHLVVQ